MPESFPFVGYEAGAAAAAARCLHEHKGTLDVRVMLLESLAIEKPT